MNSFVGIIVSKYMAQKIYINIESSIRFIKGGNNKNRILKKIK